jgi:hypothetical protein
MMSQSKLPGTTKPEENKKPNQAQAPPDLSAMLGSMGGG